MRVCLLILTLLGGASASAAGTQFWLTTADGKQRLAPQPELAFDAAAPATLRIHVDESHQYQPVEGFGASFTESSAWLIQRRLNATQRAQLLRELFDRKEGLGLGVTRVPMGASDFSRTHGTYDDLPTGQTDAALEKFSIERSRAEVLPALRAALDINPSLKVFLSPWSAPAWMKTSGSLIKGRLAPEHYDAFARYFDRTLAAFAAEGVAVYGLTIQNEPHFEPGDYPGMRVEPAERAAFIGQHLGPLLADKWPGVRLLDWDHNWDEPQSPLAVLADERARRYIAGVAWHCYGGDVSAQSQVQDRYPQLETWMTECSGGAWAPKFGESLAWMMQNLVIGNLRHGGRGAILWNLALDQDSGPHAGGCGDCRGVVTIDRNSGKVTRNVEYYVLGHASRFVQPGARRVASDSEVDGLHTVALRNPDGQLVLLVLNSAAQKREFSVLTGARSFTATLPAGAVATFTWRPEPTLALRLMSYNIRLDIASDGENAWPHRRRWVSEQIRWLRPDVFGMQEVLPGQKADLAADLPDYRFIGGGRDDGDKGEASPIAFDTHKFTLREQGLFWLSPTPAVPSKGWDAAYPRVVTWVRLQPRDWSAGTPPTVLAINTHWDHIGEVARANSAQQMARWIRENAQPCEQVLVTGDFNTVADSAPLRGLREAAKLGDARAVTRTPPFAPVSTFNGFAYPAAEQRVIDHLLLSPGIVAERYLALAQIIDGRWPSDHFPVLADLLIPACQ